MKLGPLRWVVAFFTRPIHLSDLAALLRSLKPREKAKTRPTQAAPDDDAERPAPDRKRPRSATRRSTSPSASSRSTPCRPICKASSA